MQKGDLCSKDLERIYCFISGRLIMLLLTSSIAFTAHDIIYSEKNKEISEIISFGIVLENSDLHPFTYFSVLNLCR